MKYYTGIGSRKTPVDVCKFFTQFATWMAARRWVLRSGAADGADAAFELGVPHWAGREIYLPWRGFNAHTSNRWMYSPETVDIARRFHPAWGACSAADRKMHTRNVCQVLGSDLRTPSNFVACWNPGGNVAGGTSQAIRIAEGYSIPVFNLAFRGQYEKLIEFVQKKA